MNAIRKSILIFLLRGFGKRMEAAEVLVVSGNWEFPGSLAPSDWEYPISAFRKRSSGPWGMTKKTVGEAGSSRGSSPRVLGSTPGFDSGRQR